MEKSRFDISIMPLRSSDKLKFYRIAFFNAYLKFKRPCMSEKISNCIYKTAVRYKAIFLKLDS